jgi:HEPN domain-containing protein
VQHKLKRNAGGDIQLTDSKKHELDIEAIVSHWIESSKDDLITMDKLFKSNSNNWALFVGHISLEKILKAFYVKQNKKHAPAIHNLYRLAELSKIIMPYDYTDWLDTITSFNINARYDDYKKDFNKLCTLEYTSLWIDRIKELFKWIEQML